MNLKYSRERQSVRVKCPVCHEYLKFSGVNDEDGGCSYVWFCMNCMKSSLTVRVDDKPTTFEVSG